MAHAGWLQNDPTPRETHGIEGRKGRVKRVRPAGEIAHLWMHQTQDEARVACGNFYFKGNTIYSYGEHFPIAQHVVNKRGEKAILFNARKCSLTTSGHGAAVRSAIPKGVLVIKVIDIRTSGNSSAEHNANLKYHRAEAERLIIRASMARTSRHIEGVLQAAEDAVNNAQAYAAFYGVKGWKMPVVPEPDSGKLRDIRDKEYKKVASVTAGRKKSIARYVERFRCGEAATGTLWRIRRGVPTMLRISGDEVETSHGARIPISHAKRGLRFVRAVVKSGVAYRQNGHALHLGHYAIDKIDVDGSLHAGCHHISIAEIELLAAALEQSAIQEDK